DVASRFIADWQSGGSKQCATVLIAYVDHFPRAVRHRVIRPGGELVLPTARGPGVAAAFSRHLEPERGIGDDIDPRRRGRAARVQNSDVLAAIARESAQPVEELEVRQAAIGWL